MISEDLIVLAAVIITLILFGGVIQNISETIYWKWVDWKYKQDNKNE